MSEKRKHIEHLSASEFEDYLNEQLSDLEMNRIERHLLECEFCNEAMDGYSSAGELNIQDDVDDINKLLLERTNSGKAFPFLRIAAIAISLIVLSFFTANYLFNELKRPQFTEHKTVKKENKQVETIKETKEEVNDKEGYSNAVPANDEAIELTDETETSPKLSFSVDNSIQDTESELIDADVFEIEDLEFDMTAESSESVAYGAPNQSVQAEEVQFNATVPNSDVTSTKVQNVNRKSKKSDSSISESVLDDTLLVRGKIVNEQQEAIPFAVISNKDKNSGTTSDLDGQYEIEATSGDKLEIEYIGYNSKEVIVSNVETIDVALSPGISLEEVVI